MRVFKILFISITLILILYINYKSFISSQIQPFLIADLNEGMHRYSLSDAIKADLNFPSLSGPTQPIKMLVGRYYRNEDSIDTAKKLFLDAIKDNPYIKSPQAQLAYLYLDIEEFDSAYYYAKDAFNGIPNNNVHRDIFFKTLVQVIIQRTLLILKYLFFELSPNNSSHWLGYLDSRYQIVGPQDPEILELIPRFENQFPDFDKRVVDGIKVIANSELQDLSFGASFAELGDNLFEEGDYLMAAQHYEIAISYAEYEYAFYENAAISYYLGERYDKAANYFTKVIDEFEINDGKSEFYLGILLIELDSINKGCDYLLKSSKLGFADGSTVAYNNFCN